MQNYIIECPNNSERDRRKKLTTEYNIILIFDEMKTGFRLSIGGGQQYFNVTPDLAVFGKGLANGFPISALAGKKYLMKQFEDENCFMSGSYATEKASIAASLKTLEILETENVVDHIWETGTILKNGLIELIDKYQLQEVMKIAGLSPMLHLIISNQKNASVNEIKSFIQQECVKRGFLYVGYHHTSYAHTKEDINKTLSIYEEVFELLKKTLDDNSIKQKIEGKPISAFEVRKIKTP